MDSKVGTWVDFHKVLLVITSILCFWVIADIYERAAAPKDPKPQPSTRVIKPTSTIVPASGVAGTDFELRCSGFSPSSKVSVEVLNFLSLSSARQVDVTGNLTILLDSDGWATGDYTCRVTDLSSNLFADVSIRILGPPPVQIPPNLLTNDLTSTAGWPEGKSSNYDLKYENGRYSISIGDTPDPIPIINKNFGEFTDFTAEMDVSWSGRGQPNPLYANIRAAGFVFHADADGNGIAFLVNRAGFYTLNQGPNYDWYQLIQRTDASAINTEENYHQNGPVINHLKVSVTGKTVVLSINGEIVGSCSDLPPGSGFIGVIVQGNNSQVYFENLLIQRK